MQRSRFLLIFCIGIWNLLCFACHTDDGIAFDIRGSWEFDYEGSSSISVVTFSGSLSGGTFTTDRGTTGTYTVNGSTMTMSGSRTDTVSWQKWVYNWESAGEFTDADHLTGTTTVMEYYYEYDVLIQVDGYEQIWTAIRI